MKRLHTAVLVIACVSCMALLGVHAQGPAPAAPAAAGAKKHILVIGAALGWQHDSISDTMGTVWKMGKDSGLWDTYLRTDYQLITSKPTERNHNMKNLSYFDAIVFASSTGNMTLDDDQKKDLLAFVHDQGKGLVGIHAALDANYTWPEWGEMLGGWFDAHPWMTFDAPIIREDGSFPATKHFPKAFVKKDEIYQAKAWSRDKVNVLLRLDESKLKIEGNQQVHRDDHDFAVAWSKMYGKGRVFYSTLGHTNESWDDPDIQKMYFEAIKWALGMTEGSTQPHAKPTS
jgi:type 1 glutamine amidotransferase